MFKFTGPNNMIGPIEIDDTDDEDVVAVHQMQASTDTTTVSLGATSMPDVEIVNASTDDEHNGPIITDESDFPSLELDPIEDNNPSETKRDCAVAVAAPSNDQHQSTPIQMRPKRKASKRSICSCCEPTGYHKMTVKVTQRRLMANVQPRIDPTIAGKLFECTHCDLKFTKFAYLSVHRSKVHKNGMKMNQRWFRCSRCMRRFANENDKNGHQSGCANRIYECYLCKVYVTTQKIRMQNHVRTHSGAKPFLCAVCGKCFGSNTYLARHIIFHERKQSM